MAKSAYPDEVWEAIRTLWEGVPKITWAEVIRQVGDTYRCDMPNISAVSKRAAKENWKKSKKKTGKSEGEKPLNTISYVDFIQGKIEEKIQSETLENQSEKEAVVRIFKEAVQEAENEQSKIVRQHRRQAEYLAELYQTLLSQADDLFALQLDIDDENFDEVSFKHAKLATLTEKKTNIALMLAQVGKLTQERVFKAWGITEVEDDRRVKARQQDIEAQEEELATSRAAMRSEQEKLCRERMAMVERGYFIERVEWEAD